VVWVPTGGEGTRNIACKASIEVLLFSLLYWSVVWFLSAFWWYSFWWYESVLPAFLGLSSA